MSSATTDFTTDNTTMHDLRHIQELTAALQMTEAHEVIDHRISELEAHIRSLHSLRNRKTHILSLPTEILGSILTSALQPPSFASYEATSWGKHVTFTRVCSLWREVALQCPSFWSCIPISQCRRLADMLARSKSHPLSIRIDDNTYPRHNILSDANLALAVQPHRVMELHLKATSQVVMKRYIAAIPEVIPEVRSLILDYVAPVDIFGGPTLATERACVALPLHILLTPKPALRRLELSSCAVDWKAIQASALPIRNLLNLSLQSLDPRIPHHFLLGILAASPKLETVEIRSATADEANPFSGDMHDSISLPHMRECTIIDPFVTTLNHHTHLTLPSTAKISFATQSVPSDAEGASTCVMRLLSALGLTAPSISTKLKASFHTQYEREFESLYIEIGPQAIILRLFETRATKVNLIDLLEHHTPDVGLQIPSSGVTQKTLFQILRVLGVKEAKVRTHETHNQISASFWRAFVRAHPGIDSLHVVDEDVYQICRALGSAEPVIKPKPKPRVNSFIDSSADPDNADEDLGPDCEAHTSIAYATSLALPSLQSLILEGVIFDRPTDLIHAHQSHSFSSLLTACIDRCNYSLPLPTITVRDSRGFSHEMEMLLGEVVGVDMVKLDPDGMDSTRSRVDQYDENFFDEDGDDDDDDYYDEYDDDYDGPWS